MQYKARRERNNQKVNKIIMINAMKSLVITNIQAQKHEEHID